MKPEHVRSLFDFDSWANHRLLEVSRGLNSEKFTRNLNSSFPSVRDTLTHILDAQWFWLERFQGRSHDRMPSPDRFTEVAALENHWNEIEPGIRSFVRSRSAADLETLHIYQTTSGKRFSNPFSQSLIHLVNHGTYHRGQVAAMLRQVGATPPATDLIVFYRDKAGEIPAEPPEASVLRELMDFNAWANRRMLDSAAAVSSEAFARDLGASFGSVRGTLAHIEIVEWLYLERLDGRSPGPLSPPVFDSVAALRAEWNAVEKRLAETAAAISPENLARACSFKTTAGAPFSMPVWQLLRHVVNHSTYHRGQVAMLLRQVGGKAQPTDLIAYYRERASSASA